MRFRFLLSFTLIALFIKAVVPAQEALKSVEEAYYDFLALQGITERSYLNYRTLSDSVWFIEEGAVHPWQGLNLGITRKLIGDVSMRIYGPELFTSFNTAVPYGQNDGALWQGKGFNSSLTGGARLEGYGFALTLKPQVVFPQNLAFDYMPPGFSGGEYAGKAALYGYFWGGIDAPQRFGNEPFFVYDWGDSEIRYSWRTLTIGFGTQAIWLGHSYLNPILHSNNAPTYPKLDIGFRKQKVTIPGINWYMGDIEFRIWIGRLAESDYFDNDNSNDNTMFHAFSLSYAPSFFPGFTIGANRVCLVPWSWENIKYVFPWWGNTIEDQKLSIIASYIIPKVGFEIYTELGVDDFVPGAKISGYLRYPYHTLMYTVGAKKTFNIKTDKHIYGVLIFEWNDMEMSQDFQFQWAYSPYFHSQIMHGYTNRGQTIGAGSGWAGSGQYLEFKLYYPQGTSSLFFHRNNPDNNYLYSQAVNAAANTDNLEKRFFKSWRANFNIGIISVYYILNNLSISGGFTYNMIINPFFQNPYYDTSSNEYIHNFSIHVTFKYSI
jgi:hypothetical protein